MNPTTSIPPPPKTPSPKNPSSTMTTSPELQVPIRGGSHHIYGIFLGGSPLDSNYKLTNHRLYKFSTQRRHVKSISSIERALFDARDNTTCIKFNGNLEITDPSSNELDKDHFLQAIEALVCEHGQETFYYLLDANQNIQCLWENVHSFSVEAVILKYQQRSSPSNISTSAYDVFELDDIALSRLIVESRLTRSFMERIRTRFGHHPDFKLFPGSVLLMMALDTCNASVAQDIAGASKDLAALSLSDYPGENVTNCITEAQRLVKILKGDYALPRQLGSTLLNKFTRTSSEYFNRKVFSLLDDVKTMEHKYKLTDPRSIQSDPEYSSLGPFGIIATLQQEHSSLLEDLDWPALTTELPSGNNAPVDGSSLPSSIEDTTGTKNSGGRVCFICNSAFHLANTCPDRRSKKQRDRDRNRSSGDADSPPSSRL